MAFTRCIVLVSLLLCACGEQGRTYDKQADAVAAQSGYVLLGSFGDGAWPATVTEARTERDSISFTRKDGQTHQYPDLKGYKLKLLRLEAANGSETVLVLRSK